MDINLSEEDTKKRYIDEALKNAGWDFHNISLEYAIKVDCALSDGAINLKTKKRQNPKKADYALFAHGVCVAVIEAKKYDYEDSQGIEQAKNYAKALKAPLAFSSSGKGFVQFAFDRDFQSGTQSTLKLEDFKSPQELYKYCKDFYALASDTLLTNSHFDLGEMSLRYYQQNAINETLKAAQNGQNRILLVLATGTGKTQVSYQIAHRLFNQTLPNGRKIQKILYLADRNELISHQTTRNFKSFEKSLTTIKNRTFDPSYHLYFGIYQQFISGSEENGDKVEHYKELNPDFFDLILIDECHRGSSRADSTWREILEYFSSALHIGFTATPKLEDKEEDNLDYFGAPVYQYSLKEGIDDGYLAPFEVIESLSNLTLDGYNPGENAHDELGNEIPNETFYSHSFNRILYLKPQIQYVAKEVMDFLNDTLKNPNAKTIIFCEDQRHALLMKDALLALAPNAPHNYIARITSDDIEGKELLEDFKSIKKTNPVIVTTSELLSTGVDTQMVQVIAIDKNIASPSLFKQIIGRGTRLNSRIEQAGKTHFYVLDFKGVAREFFNDPNFDGEISFISKGEIPPPKPTSTESKKKKNKKITIKPIIDKIETEVTIESKSVYYYINGTLITESLEVFSGKVLKQHKEELQSYLLKLRDSNSKEREEFLAELAKKGILLSLLKEQEGFKDCDEFDILLSLANGRPALSRKERAKKANKYLESLSSEAREILNILLEKYAQNGIDEVSVRAFKNEPFTSQYDSYTIQSILESNGGFKQVLENLKLALYEEAC